MRKREKIIGALDVGTSKVCALVGRVRNGGTLEVLGAATAESHGLRKGVIVNLEATVAAIKRAVEEVEARLGISFESACVAISGAHVRGFNSRGVVAVRGRNHEISHDDIRRVVDAAQAVNIPQDSEIIHVLPQGYLIDNQPGISYPLGMTGTTLEVNVHIITASITATQNMVTAVNRAGILVFKTIAQVLAAAEAVLTQDEKELGAVLIDIGGGTTDVAIYHRGAIWHTAVIPTGGDNFTRDIAVGLRTPLTEAERIKQSYGCALSSLVSKEDSLEVPGVGGRSAKSLRRLLLCEIINPRAEEILALVRTEVRRAGFEGKLTAGAVLTGGAALLDGMVELAEQVLEMPARRGYPINVAGLDEELNRPSFATAVGLLLYAWRARIDPRYNGHGIYSNGGIWQRLFARTRDLWSALVS